VVIDYFNSRLDAINTSTKGGATVGEGLPTSTKPHDSQPDWSVRQVGGWVGLVWFGAGWVGWGVLRHRERV